MASILIIDDDIHICKMVSEFLRRQGHDVFTAANGREGLSLAADKVPDAILCDLDMPALNGNEVVSTLRQDSRLGETPIIFLSGCTRREQIRQSMNLGADDFLTKPVSLPEIMDALNARLIRQQARRQRHQKQLRVAAEAFMGIVKEMDRQHGAVHWQDESDVSQVKSTPSSDKPHISGGGDQNSTSNVSVKNTKTLLVECNNRQQILNFTDIKAVIADGEYTRICWGKNQQIMFRKPLAKWQDELPEKQFVRVHRSTIINLAFLDFVENDAKLGLLVHLHDFATAIPVSHRAKTTFNRSLKKFQSS